MGGHGTLTGTSMAAPMVSGAVAIIAGAAPSLGEQAIRDALTGTAKDLGLAGRDDTYGSGLLDVGAALKAAAEPVTDVSSTPAVLVADGSGSADIAAIEFHVAVPVTAAVTVERADGGAVRSLSTDPLTTGNQRFEWDGTDDSGAPVPDGSYRFAIRGTAPGGIAVTVLRPIGVSLALASARVTPGSISPNGDGKADRTAASYTLRAAATVTVTVRDAAGRTVRTLASAARGAGAATVAWDGRVGAGTGTSVAPDGSYVIAVSATTTRGTYTIPLTVALSVHGVAVSSLKATPVYPVSDGYRDLSAVTYRQAGAATASMFVYAGTSATPIRAVPIGRQPAGTVSAAWDGRDAAGRVVRAGTYRVRIRTVDAGLVARWSSYAAVTVSAQRLVAKTWTITLRGDQHAPQTFVSSPDAASVRASSIVPGGVHLEASGPDDRATAFWEVAIPAHVGLSAATLHVTAVRDARGDTLAGTWNGTTVDEFGFVREGDGTTDLTVPASSLARWGSRIALAVNQDGPGSTDVGSLTLVVKYTVLK
jgi:flagellar hook assembly protein FlgD